MEDARKSARGAKRPTSVIVATSADQPAFTLRRLHHRISSILGRGGRSGPMRALNVADGSGYL